MALSVKAELQITGLGGGDLGVDGVPWQYATVADLKTLLYEELRLPSSARKEDRISLLAGISGRPLVDDDRLSDTCARGKKLTVRGADLSPIPCRRPWFAPATEVLLHGLQSAPELNGQRATVRGWDALKWRYDVLMDSTKLVKSVKPDNLQWAWISPLAADGPGGDLRQAHVPVSGAFQPSQVPIPGTHGPGGLGPAYGSAVDRGGPGLSGPDQEGCEVTYGAVPCSAAYHSAVSRAAPVAGPVLLPSPSAAAAALAAPAERLAATAPGGPSPSLQGDDMQGLQQELQRLKLEKARAIEEEDFDRAAEVKRRQKEVEAALAELPARLKSAREKLEKVLVDKAKAVEVEDFKLASELKGRQRELEARVRELEGASA
mmetsp:Transcript_5933/g.17747  ORF Transcript_5933/g.17747 Transcript_5933/m.17747 type:complete len:376 (+) Transcript_5933:110-1237(+)